MKRLQKLSFCPYLTTILILALFLLSVLLCSGCTTYPEYKFEDKVKITEGFYSGRKGVVTSSYGAFGSCYRVRLDGYDGYVSIHAVHLELRE